MTQGIFIRGERPKSKKAIKEAVEAEPERVCIEATSLHGGEFDGFVTEMPLGKTISFVGPNPYNKRNFYGSITKAMDGKVTVR